MNQCDGCRRGLILVNGMHAGPGGFWAGDMQACTAYLYADSITAVEAVEHYQATDKALTALEALDRSAKPVGEKQA